MTPRHVLKRHAHIHPEKNLCMNVHSSIMTKPKTGTPHRQVNKMAYAQVIQKLQKGITF